MTEEEKQQALHSATVMRAQIITDEAMRRNDDDYRLVIRDLAYELAKREIINAPVRK